MVSALDRVKLEHSTTCSQLSHCAKRLSKAHANVTNISKERNMLNQQVTQQKQQLDRAHHDNEIQKTLISELKAELSAVRKSSETREIGELWCHNSKIL